MKKISLSEIEVNDLLDLYQSEIDRAQRRINNLKTIVKKISEGKSIDSSEEKPVKAESKRGRKPKVKVAETKVEKVITTEPKKRGRKPKNKVEAVKAEPKKRGPKPKVKVEVKAEVKKEQKVKVAKAEPKKRGPKPKVRVVEAKVAKVRVAKAEPKKRGRKPKVVVAKAVVADEKKEVKAADKTKKAKATKKKVAKVKALPKKRGRKPKSLRKPIKGGKGKDKVKWNVFINETITSKDSLMLASSLTHAALEKFEIPASDRDRVRMAISTTLTKMANKDKILQTYTQEGIRGAFFGLAKWFDDKGELNNDYKKKLM